MTQQLLNTDFDAEEYSEDEDYSAEIVHELDISHLVIEDDTPLDNFQSAQQQRLLVDAPLQFRHPVAALHCRSKCGPVLQA